MKAGEPKSKVTPPTLARQWGVSPDKVLSWIRTGQLRAIDASARRGGRPRYLIDVADVAAFESRRAVVPARPARRRPRRPADVLHFF